MRERASDPLLRPGFDMIPPSSSSARVLLFLRPISAPHPLAPFSPSIIFLTLLALHFELNAASDAYSLRPVGNHTALIVSAIIVMKADVD